ncbi:MAG TPA: hypothetical protein DFK13_16100, partial [Erythrobacter sp.]|nr:hypothetical protein [Erythrobacter sp.]
SGCTSGHGVCGVSRLSARSIVATLTFMAAGIATVAAMNALGMEVPRCPAPPSPPSSRVPCSAPVSHLAE